MGRTNRAEIPTRARDLSQSKDLKDAITQFFKNFKAANNARVTSYWVKENVANAEDHSYSGVAGLEFEYTTPNSRKPKFGKVVLKIPSLAPVPHEKLSTFQEIFDREVHFYKTILPKLYQLGQCKPFAPQLYAFTEAKALVLENLKTDGFKPTDHINFLDLDACTKCLELLAMYHALGYKYLQSVNKNDPNWLLIKLSPMGKPNMNIINEFIRMVNPYLVPQLYEEIRRLQNKLQTTEEFSNQNSCSLH
ncbi:hypothetical protein V9T40_001906 [Parthenolecanium corni]|uniref:CHK kinase-like domain-containing protein n=1 Tax=Parthenolecanium corni TaxID=536013 RepID=A0AAN9TF91_9HEMI